MFTLPKLEYDYTALEPHIDARTMEIHYTKHHQGYVDKLNAAIEKDSGLVELSIESLLKEAPRLSDDIRQAVINNGGGHANHSLFWAVMHPEGGGEPKGDFGDVIKNTFGSFAEFKKKFSETALGRFGSGWAWLVKDGTNLSVISTANQDSPLMEGKIPILGLDVWEHAYYLKYQNRRPEYIEAWWNIVYWKEVERRFKGA